MALVQKWPFVQLSFLGNISQKSVFYHILEQKRAFLGYKNKKFKNSKNWHFSKGVNPWFWKKNGHFSNIFFLGNIDQENVSYNILQRKNTFPGYKKKTFKKLKNWHFSKGVNPWFWSKNHHFSTFLLRQYRPGKCPLRYSRTKKRLSRPNTRSSKSKKIDVFPKGLTHAFGPKVAIFANFFFRQYRPGKCLLRYSRTKKRLSRL